MKILFRPCRSSLAESLKELKKFNTMEKFNEWLRKEIFKVYNVIDYGIYDAKFSYYCFDDRINWHTYIVTFAGSVQGYITFIYS